MNKPLYFVNHGVTSRHLYSTKKFNLYRDAMNYLYNCTGNHAYNVIRWTETSDTKLHEYIK